MLVRLSGTVSVQDGDGGPRHLAGAQAQIAFARLVLDRPGGTGRSELADTLWPGELPDTWASALRGVVSRVRAFVARGPGGADALVARDGRYLLRLPVGTRVDVEQAEAAAAEAEQAMRAGRPADALRLAASAVDVLEHPFLPDHDGDWVTGQRERFAELFVGACESASRAASAQGDERAALRHAERAVRHSPLRESAHRARMSAHVAAGNRAEALRCYHLLRRTLADELGIDPGPETQAAYVELLGSPPAPRTRPRPAVEPVPRFTGRRVELAALERAWAEVGGGARRLVLVEGEPGAGRTRLVTEFGARLAGSGAVVLHGRCDDGSPVPFQPLVQALAGLAADGPARPGLSPAARSTLTRLASEPGDRLARLVPAQRGELFLALTELLLAVTRADAVVLVLDDLDRADDDTVALLGNVLRRCAAEEVALLIVATAVVPTAGSTNDARLPGEPDCRLTRLPLPGLDETDARRLVDGLPPGAADVPAPHRLVAVTAGNALLLTALLRQYRDGRGTEVSPVVARYATRRLAALDPAPRALLRAAALAGPSFELDVAARAAGLDASEALDALDALLTAGLVCEAGPIGPGRPAHAHRLTHEVLRAAVLAATGATRLRDLHSRLADAVEELRSDDLESYSRLLARHRTRGATPGGDLRAVRASWRAAAVATREGAVREAVRCYRLALDHVPAGGDTLRCDALTRLGLAQLDADDPDCGATLLDATLLALRRNRTGIAVQAALGLAGATERHPALRDEAAALVDALVTAGSATDDPARRIGGVPMGRLLAHRTRLGRAPGDLPGADAALSAMLGELALLEGPGTIEWRQTLAVDALDLAIARGAGPAQVLAVHHLASAAEMRGDAEGAGRALTRLAEVVAADGGGDGHARLVEHAVAVAVAEGRFTDAAVLARAAPMPAGSPVTRQMLVARWLRSGARAVVPGTAPEACDPVDRPLAALLAGDRGAAHVQVRAHAIGAAPLPEGDEWLHAVGVLALCAVELGDPGTAAAVRALLLPFADLTCGIGYRTFVGPVAFHLGRLAAVTGDWDEAERYLTAAMPRLTERRARPWIGLAQHDLARVLESRAASGDRWCARALRSEASWTLTSLGVRHPA